MACTVSTYQEDSETSSISLSGTSEPVFFGRWNIDGFGVPIAPLATRSVGPQSETLDRSITQLPQNLQDFILSYALMASLRSEIEEAGGSVSIFNDGTARPSNYAPPWQLGINSSSRRTVATWYYGQNAFETAPTCLRQTNMGVSKLDYGVLASWLKSLDPHHRATLAELRIKSLLLPTSSSSAYDELVWREGMKGLHAMNHYLVRRGVDLGKTGLKTIFLRKREPAMEGQYYLVWCNEDEAHELRDKTGLGLI